MTVGLHIPPELLSMNLRPPALLVAAEILQFGRGKCHARTSHFEIRFNLSKNTVLDAFKALRKIKILTEDGPIKVINLENYCSEIALESPEIGPDRSESDCQEDDPKCSEIASNCSESEGSVQKLDPDLNIEDNKKKQEVYIRRVTDERLAWNEKRKKNFDRLWKEFPKRVARDTAEKYFMELTNRIGDNRTRIFLILAIEKFTEEMQRKKETEGSTQMVTRLSKFLKDKAFDAEEYEHLWQEADAIIEDQSRKAKAPADGQ